MVFSFLHIYEFVKYLFYLILRKIFHTIFPNFLGVYLLRIIANLRVNFKCIG